MWRTTSTCKSVSTKLKTVSHYNAVCRLSTSGSLQQQTTPPSSLKDPLPPEAQKKARDTSAPPPPPPPPQPRKSGLFSKLFATSLVVGAGAVGYAWYSTEFRHTVQDNVPYSKEAFEALFVYLPDSPSVPAPFLSDKPRPVRVIEPAPVMPSDATSPPSKLKIPQPTESVKQEQVETDSERKRREDKEAKLREQEAARRRQEQKEADIKADNAALEVQLETLMDSCEMEIHKALELVSKAVSATAHHTQLLKTAMDDTTNILEKDGQWQAVSLAYDARNDATGAAESVLQGAKENLEKLKQAIETGKQNKDTKNNKVLWSAVEKRNKLSSELNKKIAEMEKAESAARIMTKYKSLVDEGRQQFKKELDSITPEAKIGKGRKLTEDELNALIAHAHRRVEQLQKQLAEQMAMEQQRIQESMQMQQQEDDKLAEQRVKMAQQKLQDEFVIRQRALEADARIQFEEDLKHQLSRQTAAHSLHLQEVLRIREQELYKEFEHKLQERIIQERQKVEFELSGLTARLRGIEKAVEGRAEIEKVAQAAQELWLACVALSGAIRMGNEKGRTWEEQLEPLAGKVDAIFFLAKNNPFVGLVLESIPEKALTRGVYTEENLKERFQKVQKIARRVALIDETGGSLVKYALSYLQSFFIFNSVYAKSHNDEVLLEDLDTFQIVFHADYWLRKGDLEQALRFMNQLKGEPRRAAADWIEEARLFLETKQAAQTMMAFASATGLGTLF